MNATSVISTARTSSTGVRWWKSANVRLWIIQAVLAVGYVAAALPKLGNDPRMVANFADLGVSATGMHGIGVLELAGATGLLVPRLVGAAATGLVALMIGAVTLTVVHLGVQDAVAPVPFLALAAVVAWYRRDRTVRLAAGLAGAVRR